MFPLPVADEGNCSIGLPQKWNFCGKRRNNGTDGIFANSGNSGVEFVTTRQRGCGIRRMGVTAR